MLKNVKFFVDSLFITFIFIYLCGVINSKDMLRQTKLRGELTVNIDGFKATTKLRTRSVKTGGAKQSLKSTKTNKIVRCMGIADRMPVTFIRIAEEQTRKENRAEHQRNSRRAKRSK